MVNGFGNLGLHFDINNVEWMPVPSAGFNNNACTTYKFRNGVIEVSLLLPHLLSCANSNQKEVTALYDSLSGGPAVWFSFCGNGCTGYSDNFWCSLG